jgi:hypothetical protein
LALCRGKEPGDLDTLGLSPRAQMVVRTAVTAAGTDWGTHLAEGRAIAQGFMDLLRHRSVFYAIINDVTRLPFNVRVGAILTGAGASVLGPGQPVVVSKLNFGNAALERRRAAAIVVLTDQLVREIGVGERLIGQSLRDSVSEAVDGDVINNILLPGVTPTSSSGEPLADLRTLLTAVGPTEGSRPYWIAHPGVGIRISTAGSSPAGSPALPGGLRLFSEATASGGTLLGYPLLVSSKVPAGMLMLVDASRLAGASDTISLQASGEADVELRSDPTMSMGSGSPLSPSGAQVISLFQTNSVGVMATAYCGLIAAPPRGGGAKSRHIGW